MSDVAFVFSNPRHHLEMMAPVAEELARRGIECTLVSLAELRGFETPKDSGARRAIPVNVRRRSASPPASGGRPADRAPDTRRRRLAQKLVWNLGLGPRLSWMLRDSRVIVVP